MIATSPKRAPLAPALAAALAAVLATTPAAAQAQVTLNTDVVLASAYVFRGVTFTNRPVLQPDAYLTVAAGRGVVVTGAALNVEPVAYEGVRDLSVLGAESGTLVTATTLWSEYTRPMGRVSGTVGVTGYLYPHANGIAAAYNTAEVYTKLAFAGFLSPSLALYHDVGQVRGAYAEAGLRHTMPAGKRVALNFAGAAGVSLGQGTDARGRESAYFAGNGLTHVDLSVAATWSTGAVSITPNVHALFDRDAATRLTAPDERHAAKLTAGMSLGWGQALAR